VRASEVVLRDDRLFVGSTKRAIANTVCITVFTLIERPSPLAMYGLNVAGCMIRRGLL
jgi:hypothetical protein